MPSPVWRSAIASGLPGRSSPGPGSLAAPVIVSVAAISALHLHDEVEERVGDLDELVRDAVRDGEDVALAELVLRAPAHGLRPKLAGRDFPRIDHLAAGDDGRRALDDVHDVDGA